MNCFSLMDNKNRFDEVCFKKLLEITKSPEIKYYNWDLVYIAVDPLEIDRETLQRIEKATELCGAIYQKAVKFVLLHDKLLNLLGIPDEAISFCKSKNDMERPVTAIGRFDFVLDRSGSVKLLEFNSDTPTGIVEACELNALISKLKVGSNPNKHLVKNIKIAFNKFVKGCSYKNIAFTSLDWYPEDRGTVLAEMEYSGLPARYVPLDNLEVRNDGLYDDVGEKVDLLYRLYPVEWFAQEEDGRALINLVAKGKLELLNPPSAFIAQSKVMQAVIWELATNTNYFSIEEKEIVFDYFLPTYLDASHLAGKQYVTKPAYGREGGGVCLYNKKGQIERFTINRESSTDPVYQLRVDLPQIKIKTWLGEYSGKLLIGSFLVGGKFSGIYLRVGEDITGDMSYYLPAIVK